MRERYTFLIACAISASLSAQNQYFPPLIGNTWEMVDPASLGWCTEEIPPLITYLGDNNTKAFIVLKDGRIAIEHYYGTFTQDSLWYWASAGKSLTAFLVGKAQEEGFLDIDDPSSDYLGSGWTSCTPGQEAAITIRHQLSMTTGLDDTGPDVDCTDPACLEYLAEPGTRWAYHNAAYTRLDGVITAATGQTLNGYVFNKLTLTTGLQGAYVPIGFNNVFVSKPRSFARFGLLALNQGIWNGTAILNDAGYFSDMTTPSQAINEAYGYLWWLNGQSTYMVPGLQLVIPGMLIPNQPADAFNALGKNGQILNVVPSQGLVVIRMGNAPGSSVPVPYLLVDEMWQHLNLILCTTTGVAGSRDEQAALYPLPADDRIRITGMPASTMAAQVITLDGRSIAVTITDGVLDTKGFANGSYWLVYAGPEGSRSSRRFVISR